jgi:hypothetical protein
MQQNCKILTYLKVCYSISRMDVDKFVEQFGDVLLACPVGASQEQMTLAEFSKLDVGQKFIGAMATSHALLAENGMDNEQALTIVGGAALVRDENEKIIGLSQPVTDLEVSTDAGTKKKLMSPFLSTQTQTNQQ